MPTGSALAESVKTLIAEHGETVTFRRVTAGGYDPATGTTAAGSTDDEIVKVAFVQYRENLVDGTNIQRGDRKALLSASAATKVPKSQDQFIGVGDTVNVVSVQTIQSGGVDAAYICQVRE